MNVRKLYFDRLNRTLNAIETRLRLIKRAQADEQDPLKILDKYLKDYKITVNKLLAGLYIIAGRVYRGEAGHKAIKALEKYLTETEKMKHETLVTADDILSKLGKFVQLHPEHAGVLQRVLPAGAAIVLLDMPEQQRREVIEAINARVFAQQPRQPAQQSAAQPSQQTQRASGGFTAVQRTPTGQTLYRNDQTGQYMLQLPNGRIVPMDRDQVEAAMNREMLRKERPWAVGIMTNPRYTDQSKFLEDKGMTEDAERLMKYHLQQYMRFDDRRTMDFRRTAELFAEERDGKPVVTANSIKSAIVYQELERVSRLLMYEQAAFADPARVGWSRGAGERPEELRPVRMADAVRTSIKSFEHLANLLAGLTADQRWQVFRHMPRAVKDQLISAYTALQEQILDPRIRDHISPADRDRLHRVQHIIETWHLMDELLSERSPRPDFERQLASGKPQQTQQQRESAQKSPTERADQYFAAASMPPPRPTESTTRPPYESFAFTRTSMPTYPFEPQTSGTTETTDQSRFEQPMLRPEIMNQARLEQPVLRPETLASAPGQLFQYLPLRPGTTETMGQPNAGQPAQGSGRTGFGNGPLASGPFPFAQIPTYPYPAQKPSLPVTNRELGIV